MKNLLLAGLLTCEAASLTLSHCWDTHGNTVITEERSGAYIHGHDNTGHAWTTWEHDGRTTTWPTR